MSKIYYGIKFLSTNRLCTRGAPHPRTGRMSKAVDVIVFETKAERDTWIGKDIYMRISGTKAECRKMCLGESVEDFLANLEYLRQ